MSEERKKGRWAEDKHVIVGGTITVAAIFAFLYGFAWWFPPDPSYKLGTYKSTLQSNYQPSLQERRR